MLVNVSAPVAVGVHLKLFVTFMSKDRSLSVVTVPLCGAVHVVLDDGVAVLRVPVASGSVSV
jgi:hypothetical protein